MIEIILNITWDELAIIWRQFYHPKDSGTQIFENFVANVFDPYQKWAAENKIFLAFNKAEFLDDVKVKNRDENPLQLKFIFDNELDALHFKLRFG